MEKLMKRILFNLMIVAILAGCGSLGLLPTPSATATTSPTSRPPTATVTLAATATKTPVPTFTATPNYPLEGRGPTFTDPINPLTGLEVDPGLLNRRPIIVKVQNMPREERPQWGLAAADLVYEYYTELGSTRFAALYYGTDAEKVGPVRSARHFDANIIQAYGGTFLFGSAYEGVWNRLVNSNYANRLVVESPYSCPSLCRGEGGYLFANTSTLATFLKQARMDNTRPNLDGMIFQARVPAGGESVPQVYVRFSAAVYNRWDYDPISGRYLRFSDTKNDVDGNNEGYAALTDKTTGKPIGAENVVILLVPYTQLVKTSDSEVWDASMLGQGTAYIARDGQWYAVTWQRLKTDSVLSLLGADGKPFPFKPGQTWFEVVGAASTMTVQGDARRITFITP
jgi:hypothetical protein